MKNFYFRGIYYHRSRIMITSLTPAEVMEDKNYHHYNFMQQYCIDLSSNVSVEASIYSHHINSKDNPIYCAVYPLIGGSETEIPKIRIREVVNEILHQLYKLSQDKTYGGILTRLQEDEVSIFISFHERLLS